jgi:hypothetical protein
MLLLTGAPKNGFTPLAQYLIQLHQMTTTESFDDGGLIDPRVASINNDILRLSGCSWCHAPNGTTFKADGAINYRICSFLNHNDDIDFLVDPRFAFTWPLWEKVAKDIDLLITFRNPGEAALSFRDEFGGFACEAITVWSQHYTRLASVKGAVVEFGASIDVDEYEENVGRAMRFLELEHHSPAFHKIYNDTLITHTKSTSTFPPIKKIYQLLQSRKEN